MKNPTCIFSYGEYNVHIVFFVFFFSFIPQGNEKKSTISS